MKTLVLVPMGQHISQPDATPEGIADIRNVHCGIVVYSEELMKLGL